MKHTIRVHRVYVSPTARHQRRIRGAESPTLQRQMQAAHRKASEHTGTYRAYVLGTHKRGGKQAYKSTL